VDGIHIMWSPRIRPRCRSITHVQILPACEERPRVGKETAFVLLNLEKSSQS
jgi:hypothetical protein